MTEATEKQLQDMNMAELWNEAKRLGISKAGKKDELIARIKKAQESGEQKPSEEKSNSENQPTKQSSDKEAAQKAEPAKEVVYISRYLELKLVMNPSYLKEVGGKVLIIRGKYIQFHEGVYKTKDQEEIEYLDNHPNFGSVFRKVQTTDLKGGKSVDQIYQEKFRTLEEREKEVAAREKALQKKEVEMKGAAEGADTQKSVIGIRGTAEQPQF
jgi:hypothetical protein